MHFDLGKRISQKFSHPHESIPNDRFGKGIDAIQRPTQRVRRHANAKRRIFRCGALRVFGGAEEDRTPDLRIANATLSQLSYRPKR
jgi:hypothetical protein